MVVVVLNAPAEGVETLTGAFRYHVPDTFPEAEGSLDCRAFQKGISSHVTKFYLDFAIYLTIFTATVRSRILCLCRGGTSVVKNWLGVLSSYRIMADASIEPSRKRRRLGEQ